MALEPGLSVDKVNLGKLLQDKDLFYDADGKIISEERILRLACCQLDLQIEKKEIGEKLLQFAEEAISFDAKLIVFPELATTRCQFSNRDEARAIAEIVPAGDTTQTWIDFTKKHGIYLAAGIAEREDDKLYNTSILLGPKGYLGKYRKLHLTGFERMFFESGNLGLPVFTTDYGRIAMCICNDMWFPETIRIYALEGADLVLNFANWSATKRFAEAINFTYATLNSVFLATAARIGNEKGYAFLGKSIIVSPTGDFLAGPVSDSEEKIIYADCNLAEAKLCKWRSMVDHLERDRRTDIYDSLLGYGGSSSKNHVKVNEAVLNEALKLGVNVSDVSEDALRKAITQKKAVLPRPKSSFFGRITKR